MVIGLTADRTSIQALSVPAGPAHLPRVLIIGGLDGDEKSAKAVMHEVEHYNARRFHLLAIPKANPNKVRLVFPPTGRAYKENPESHYIWRWIGTQAPDLVLIEGKEDYGLAEALSKKAVAGVGRIPAQSGSLSSAPKQIAKSEARLEMERRSARTPRQVAEELAQVYGLGEFPEAVYITAVALIGQLRLGHVSDVEHAVAPFADGSKDSLAKATSSHFAGHLVFGELAERTGKPEYVKLVRKAADMAFTDTGEMKEAMPLHNEMSDAVFMACPILAKAGKLTHDRKYFDMTLRHFQFMQKLDVRPDGLYRHSPLDQAAWGRGNAFPALGLALTLSDLPKNHPSFEPILKAFRSHMEALAPFQDENGMWREVIDFPGSYPEFSATAMIATAMLRGIRSGWLEAERYQPRVDKAWAALKTRIASDGRLIDVCESTGKQSSLDAYLQRLAILDRDPRGGAMALLISTEMAGLQ